MHTIQSSYRGIALLLDVNWDRLLYPATIAVALSVGAYLGALSLG